MSYRDDFRYARRETHWTIANIVPSLILIAFVVGGLAFVGNAIGFASFKFWAPKMENARREVFENTQSYVQGKTDYLSKMRLEFETAPSDTHKAALRRMILTQAATVDNSKLPADLQAFIQSLK